MKPWQTVRVAIRALLRNKLRSFLTALGIIIGVAAVIAMVAIGEGAKSRVRETIAAMGSNLLIIMPGSSSSGGARGGYGSQPTITADDLDAIRQQLPAVRYAAPVPRSGAQVVSDEQNWSTRVQGTTPDYFGLRNWRAASGRLLTESDLDGAAKVVVLGQTVVEKLFGAFADPVGQSVRIKGIPFEIVGVLERKGQSANGEDYDDAVIVPYTTFLTKIQGGLRKYVSGWIMIGAASAEDTPRAQIQIEGLLRDRHRIGPGQDDDFSVRNLTEMANAQQEGTQVMTMLLAFIAGISLVVGGIGVMNIMLVSVSERTREIGIRMAVGARPSHILVQFLVEALTLATAGGAIGVAMGCGGALLLGSAMGWPVLIRPDVVAISVGFSGLVGVVFGLYPARKASQLDPIDALRWE
jgi:putative ABC transport system permease protein